MVTNIKIYQIWSSKHFGSPLISNHLWAICSQFSYTTASQWVCTIPAFDQWKKYHIGKLTDLLKLQWSLLQSQKPTLCCLPGQCLRDCSLFSLGSESIPWFGNSLCNPQPHWIHGRHQNLNTFLLFAAHLCTPETLFILQSCLGSVLQKTLIVKLYIDSTAGKSHLSVFWGLALQECPPVSWASVGIQHRHQIFWINNLIGGERKKKTQGKNFHIQRHIKNGEKKLTI